MHFRDAISKYHGFHFSLFLGKARLSIDQCDSKALEAHEDNQSRDFHDLIAMAQSTNNLHLILDLEMLDICGYHSDRRPEAFAELRPTSIPKHSLLVQMFLIQHV